jgi:nitrogen fixation NifU-like protein
VDLADLYQEIIIDHNRSPRNFRRLDSSTHHAEGYNPLCGDRLTVYLDVADGVIRDVAFQGSGCAISVAAGSLMTECLKGRACADAHALFEHFREFVTTDTAPSADLGKLAVLGGVRAYPSRVKCATLCWHTLEAALKGESGATTE